jgi:hypothetical protein
MSILNAKQILEASDLKHVDIDVPEWGGTVRLRVMKGTERNVFEREWAESTAEAKASGGRSVPLFRERLLARCACDDKNQRIFTDEDIEKLSDKSAAVLDRLAKVCLEVNGFTKEAAEAVAKN